MRAVEIKFKLVIIQPWQNIYRVGYIVDNIIEGVPNLDALFRLDFVKFAIDFVVKSDVVVVVFYAL